MATKATRIKRPRRAPTSCSKSKSKIRSRSCKPQMAAAKLMSTLLLMAVFVDVQTEREEMLIPSRLVVRYTPPVSAAVSKNHKTKVEFHAQLNLSGLLNPDTVGLHIDDPDYVPLWLRCPGRLTAVPEPERLLEIINDTIDVLPMDFMAGINTVLVLCGKQLGHVRLMLYWELVNASMCTELVADDDEAIEMTTTKTATTMNEQWSTQHPLVISSGPTASERPHTSASSSYSVVRPILNKTFVIVRGSGGRKRRSLTTTTTTEAAKCESNSTCIKQRDRNPSNKIVIDNGYYVHVLQEENVLDEAIIYVTTIIAALNMFLIGFKVKLDDVKSILRRPVGPSIGLLCQLLLLPLVSYIVAFVMFKDEKNLQLGLFALGTSPTAVLSNSWTLILKGNVHLSVTMTAISVLCALLLMPLIWFRILDQTILPGARKTIPRTALLISSATLAVPLCISMILKSTRPSLANVVAKIDRPAIATLMFALNSMAIVTLWSMLPQINWAMAIAGLIVACLGYTSGWTLATVCRMERHSVTSVSIVTAFQNANIAYAFIQLSLQKPDSDLSCVQPYVQIVATNALLLLMNCFCDTVYRKKHSKRTVDLPPQQQELTSGIAEPLMIRAVFASDTKAATSYIANEPLTSEIMDDANTLNQTRNQMKYSNTPCPNEDINTSNNTFNTFGK